MTPSYIRLPVRVAHPPKPQLEHLDDAYFEFLVKCGYEGLYLQDSPFDTLTGNHGNFKKEFHLMYLYDLARGRDRQRYTDYINEVCHRAARHGLATHLNCWEPRLPFHAWGETPPEWRGRGGFAYGGDMHMTSFCWSEPSAVAYWKQMALDAFTALPDLAGVHLGVVDNEADFCSDLCPKCRGTTKARQLEDIYSTFAGIKALRTNFRIAIYDWWLPSDLLDKLPAIVGKDALIIGRSSQGHSQSPLSGEVEDMTAIFDGCGPGIIQKKTRADQLGLRLVDMPAWTHPNESWWLPSPPDPRYAVNKLNALCDLGAAGWYDFDCGSTEPGSIAEAITIWTNSPEASPEEVVCSVIENIFGPYAARALPAYEEYRTGKSEFPIAYEDPVVRAFSGRCTGLGCTLFSPFDLEDFRFVDLEHGHCWVAAYNFVVPSILPVVLPRLENVTAHMRKAHETVRALPVFSPRAEQEKDTFEIYYRHYRAILNYFQLGKAKLDWVNKLSTHSQFRNRVEEIAADETENLVATEAWHERNPHCFFNPCHSLIGWLESAWPNRQFQPDLFLPKRDSLKTLPSQHPLLS